MATDLFKTLDTISAFHNYNLWIYSNIRPYLKGVVLDVGSGIGDVARYYKQNSSVTKVILSDESTEMLFPLNKKFKDAPGHEVIGLNISQQNATALGNLSVDSITMINVLEHIEDDGAALRNASTFLKPGAVIILVVPACPGIYGSLDKLVGHYRRYTRTSMRKVIAQTGLKVKKEYYMNMTGIMTWFIAGRILKQKEFHPKMGKALDRVVPFFQFLENFIKPRIGQSLICVCEKLD